MPYIRSESFELNRMGEEYADTTLTPQPTSNVVFVTDTTSAQGASETPSSPLDVTMLAMLGLTMAGAGVMKSQSAQKKQQELAQANAVAQAQLATAKAEQAQTASANWEQNQTMQANATQKVYTQVQQSQANIDFWASYAAWKIAVRENQRKQRLLQLQNVAKILSRPRNNSYSAQQESLAQTIARRTTVTISLFNDRGNRPGTGAFDASLGTIAMYNGQEVLVTHDHFDSSNRNKCGSLEHIQEKYDYMFVQGEKGQTITNTHDLGQLCVEGTGVTIFFRENGYDFGATHIAAEINYSTGISVNQPIVYPHIPGPNLPQLGDGYITITNPETDSETQYHTKIQLYWLLAIAEGLIDNKHSFRGYDVELMRINGGLGTQGDSGAGLFDADGRLIGVFQLQTFPQDLWAPVLNAQAIINRLFIQNPNLLDDIQFLDEMLGISGSLSEDLQYADSLFSPIVPIP